MPASLSYPGVYIEEVPSGVRTIAGVATSIAAFVGYTRKGAPNKAVTLTSFADFERSHGGLDRDSPVSYAVRQFFANGGTQAVVVRVASGYSTAGWTLQDGSPTAVLQVSAASPGAWGNGLRITVDYSARNPEAEFNLTVSQVQADNTLVPVEVHRNLNMDSRSAQYVVSVINSASSLVRVSRTGGLAFANAGSAVSKPVAFPLGASDLVIAGTANGDTAFNLKLTTPPTTIDLLVDAVNAAITAAGLGGAIQASKSNESGGDSGTTNCLKLRSLTAGESSSVTMSAGALGGFMAKTHLGLANGGKEFTGNAQRRPAVVTNVLPGVTGLDGVRGGAADLLGSESAKTGIYALLDVDLFNILSIPETFDMTGGQEAGLIPFAVALCEKRRAFFIVDAPSNRTLDDIDNWSTLPASRNAAVYFPPVRIVDPLDGFRARPMAPSGTVAGVYARTDATRGIWKAPAGTDATLNGVLDLTLPMNDVENGTINPVGINALRSFPAYGRVVWGARTTKGSDQQADEYKYVPVRRLALFLEESLYRGTQWVVFEPNDEPLWAQIRLNLGAFMQNLFRQGAFQGRSPREAYFVKCDKETTTQNDINLGVVNIVVGFAPLKPAEFVVIKLQQIAGQIQA